jgi:hypothetical protein
MLTIIHGNNTAQSRKFFLDEKNKFPDATILDAEKVNLTDLAQIFEGGGLFGEARYVFIEQLLTKRKKSADFKDILSYLEKNAGENAIFLWEGKELETASLKLLKNAVVRPFKLPQTLFQFLDAIKPGNSNTLIKLFHQTVENAETEMIFFMLVRQFRILLALSPVIPAKVFDAVMGTGIQTNADSIDEIKRMAPWQKDKLQKQAKLFDSSHLLNLYEKLFEIELAQKTGGLSSPLTSTIDFFLLEV